MSGYTLRRRFAGRSTTFWLPPPTRPQAVPITAPLVAFATLALLGYDLSIADVFAANTIFVQFRRNADTLAIGVGIAKTLALTLERVQRYLDLPEREPRAPLRRDLGASSLCPVPHKPKGAGGGGGSGSL